jgi:hypothetical protein
MTTKYETVEEWLARIDGDVLPKLEAITHDLTIPEDERRYVEALLKLYTSAVERSRKDGDDEPTAKYLGAAQITFHYEMGRSDIATLEKETAWHKEHI